MVWTTRLKLAVGALAAAAGAGVLAGAPAAAGVHASGTWGTAITLPGISTLNHGDAKVDSMSCPASGDCVAVGSYQHTGTRTFVAGETGGTWGAAQQFRGVATLTPAAANQVSCGQPGDCVAGGTYKDASGKTQGWLASETGGVWHAAHAVNGLAALNTGGDGAVIGVSCPAGTSGDCTASGIYTASQELSFVISEHGGTWGKATPLPGQGTLPGASGSGAFVNSLSCAPGAAGNCAVAGSYFAAGETNQAFVADSVGGVWANAEEIPGTAGLNAGGFAQGEAVSCPSAGNCTLGGVYSAPTVDDQQGFVAQQSGGVWAGAQAIPGLAALNQGGGADFSSLSCGAAGDCAAGGDYVPSITADVSPSFVVAETGGVWGQAEQVPGLPAIPAGDVDLLHSVSCPSAGECWAGGSYSTATGVQAYVVNETSGTWQTAQEVPGTGCAEHSRQRRSIHFVVCAGRQLRAGRRLPVHQSRHQRSRAGVRRRPELTGSAAPVATISSWPSRAPGKAMTATAPHRPIRPDRPVQRRGAILCRER